MPLFKSTDFYSAFVLSCKDQTKMLGNGLYKLYLNQSFVDVTLHCVDAKIKAHSNVLVTASNYFKKRLDKQTSLSLPNIKGDTMSTILQFIYTGRAIFAESAHQDVLAAAQSLEIDVIAKETFAPATGDIVIEDQENLDNILKKIDSRQEDDFEKPQNYFVMKTEEIESTKRRVAQTKQKSKLSEDDIAAEHLLAQMKSEVKPENQNILLEADNSHGEYFISDDGDGCYLLQELGSYLPGTVPHRKYDSDESTQEASDCECPKSPEPDSQEL